MRSLVLSALGVGLVFGACSGADEAGERRSGGKGGSAGSGGAGGEAGKEMACGTTTCEPVVTATMTLSPCCPDGTTNRCGLDVTEAAASLGLSAGCIEIGQSGNADATCPALPTPVAASSAPDEFAGCCRAGTCGARVDLRDAIGVDFGCVDYSSVLGAGQPRRCGGTGGTGGTAGQGGESGGGGTAGTSAGASGEGGEGGQGTEDPMCSTSAPCSWRQAMPANSPPVLAWAAMAHDAARGNTILFGGAATINGGALSDRTWSWNGTTWVELFPVDKPSARWTHGMVYDGYRQRIVLFGGLSSDQVGSGLDDTWEWNGTNWIHVTTTDAPDPRGVHGALAYDSMRRRVVLRGGGTFPGQTVFGDTWEYDGTTWVEVAGAGPDPLVAPAVAYDDARRRVTFFGGGTWNPYSDETWTFDGTTWSELMPTVKPSPRQSARLVYDPTRSILLLFGGHDGTERGDMWEWNGTSWRELSVTGPPPRCCYAYALDLARSEAVLFGGSDNQTWVYGQ